MFREREVTFFQIHKNEIEVNKSSKKNHKLELDF